MRIYAPHRYATGARMMTDEELIAHLRKGTGDGLQAWDWMRAAADAIERLTRERDEATLRATVFKRQYRQACEDHAVMRHQRDEARAALMPVVDAVRAFLPPDGISADEFISRVIAATDNPTVNPVIARLEHGRS
jgi:hypothetical protein